MTMPGLWWLLGLALACQLAFLLPRLKGKPGDVRTTPWHWALLACGGLAGLTYAWIVRDAVFALGQGIVLWLAARRFAPRRRRRHG